jgi:hypothetical protein
VSYSHWGMFGFSKAIRGEIPLSLIALFYDDLWDQLNLDSQGCS